MPQFNEVSKKRLLTCDKRLQRVFNEVIKHYDCTVLCGHRGDKEQAEAFRTGKSKLQFPLSKHNKLPSLAVDVVPYPIDWNDKTRFYHFAGFVIATAKSLGIELTFGGDWNNDFNFKNETFHDLPHFEIRGE
jgi:peptidoglycan LD-endopeptidase CwlK